MEIFTYINFSIFHGYGGCSQWWYPPYNIHGCMHVHVKWLRVEQVKNNHKGRPYSDIYKYIYSLSWNILCCNRVTLLKITKASIFVILGYPHTYLLIFMYTFIYTAYYFHFIVHYTYFFLDIALLMFPSYYYGWFAIVVVLYCILSSTYPQSSKIHPS